MLPEDKATNHEMSVADEIKYIVSLGSILPQSNRGNGSADPKLKPALTPAIHG